MYKSDCAQYLL